MKLLDDRRKGIPREAKKRLTALADEAAELEEKIEQYSTGIQQGQSQAESAHEYLRAGGAFCAGAIGSRSARRAANAPPVPGERVTRCR